MKLNRPALFLTIAALLIIDAALTWFSFRNGTLEYGRSPVLDVWDLFKALAIGGVLLITARRVGSRGLAVLGWAAVLVGVVGSSHLHEVLAGLLLPGVSTGLGKFVLLSSAVVVVVIILFVVRDTWPHFTRVRRVAAMLLLALLVVGGVLDLIGWFDGTELIEESAERLVMSIGLALSLSMWKGT